MPSAAALARAAQHTIELVSVACSAHGATAIPANVVVMISDMCLHSGACFLEVLVVDCYAKFTVLCSSPAARAWAQACVSLLAYHKSTNAKVDSPGGAGKPRHEQHAALLKSAAQRLSVFGYWTDFWRKAVHCLHLVK